MKTLRIRLARWLAQRDEQTARDKRRELRDHNRRNQADVARLDRRARGRRLYAAWTQATTPQGGRASCLPDMRHPAACHSLAGIRAVLAPIHIVRRAA